MVKNMTTQDRIWVLLAFMAALVLFGLLRATQGNPYVDGDFSWLLEPPYLLLTEGRLDITYQKEFGVPGLHKLWTVMPLQMILNGALFSIWGPSLHIAALSGALEGLAAVLLVAVMAWRGSSPRAAILAVLIAALFFRTYAAICTTSRGDVVCLMFSLASLLALDMAIRQRRLGLFAASGMLAALSLLGHGNGLVSLLFGGGGVIALAVLGRLPRKSVLFFAMGASGPLLVYVMWLGSDIIAVIQALIDIFYQKKGDVVAQQGPQHVAHGLSFGKFIIESLQVEVNFRLHHLMLADGRAGPIIIGLGVVLAAITAIWSPRLRLFVGYVVFVGAFLIWARPNKTLNYAPLFLLPAAGLVAAFVDISLIRLRQNLPPRFGGMAIMAVLALGTAGAGWGVAQKVLVMRSDAGRKVPYDGYTAYMRSIIGSDAHSILGDPRFGFGFRYDKFVDFVTEFEQYNNAKRPIEDVLSNDWIVLSDDQSTRLAKPEARAFLDKHYATVAEVTAYPYGHTTILQRRDLAKGDGTPVVAQWQDGALVIPGALTWFGQIPLSAFDATSTDAVVTSSAGDMVDVTTSSAAYGYQLFAGFPVEDPAGYYRFETTVSLLSGGGAMGVLDATKTRWLTNIAFPPGTSVVTGDFAASGNSKVFVVVQNNNPLGGASHFRFGAMRIGKLDVRRVELAAP